MPTLAYPTDSHAASVEPEPANGSSTMPLPSGSTPRISCRKKDWGFRLGCGASARSEGRVGEDSTTSPNGRSAEILLKPPVPHFRRLSWTRPSSGLRNTSHGSHIDRGMTLTSENSTCASLGRSPPRIVITNLTISPRRSRPDRDSAFDTTYERRGLLATTTFAPGTSTGRRRAAQAVKNCSSASRSVCLSTVNRGNGERLEPSKEGGILQTPPLPALSFLCSISEYSTNP